MVPFYYKSCIFELGKLNSTEKNLKKFIEKKLELFFGALPGFEPVDL